MHLLLLAVPAWYIIATYFVTKRYTAPRAHCLLECETNAAGDLAKLTAWQRQYIQICTYAAVN